MMNFSCLLPAFNFNYLGTNRQSFGPYIELSNFQKFVYNQIYPTRTPPLKVSEVGTKSIWRLFLPKQWVPQSFTAGCIINRSCNLHWLQTLHLQKMDICIICSYWSDLYTQLLTFYIEFVWPCLVPFDLLPPGLAQLYLIFPCLAAFVHGWPS